MIDFAAHPKVRATSGGMVGLSTSDPIRNVEIPEGAEGVIVCRWAERYPHVTDPNLWLADFLVDGQAVHVPLFIGCHIQEVRSGAV